MNKAMPLIILMVMVGMLLIGWKNILDYNKTKQVEFEEHLKAAQDFMEKEVYIDAVSEYEAALRLSPQDYEIAVQIVDLYRMLEMDGSYLSACEKAINADSKQLDPYLWEADHYLASNSYGEAYPILMRAKNNLEDTSEIDKRLIEILGHYNTVTLSYGDFQGWVYDESSNTGYAVISEKGKYGLLNSSNSLYKKCEYDDIGLPMSGLIPIKKDGEYYYINAEGYRKVVPDRAADWLGCFHDGYAVIRIGDQYGYIDRSGSDHHVEYDHAGGFWDQRAAVEKDGKWALIDTSFKQITGFDFDEILTDAYGFCTMYGVFWAKRDGAYYLYDLQGNCISDGYEAVKLFASDEPAAVMQDGKWGFISKEGELVTGPTYEDADSFSLGYAPFCKNGKWGCIDADGNVLIKPEFDSLKPFSQNGYALAEQDGLQEFIVITIYG